MIERTQQEKPTPERGTLEKKVFTNQRKKPKTTINISRKGSIVKERCRQLCEIALRLFPNRIISDCDLKGLVMMYVGCDKETIRSYCGYYGHIRQGKYGDNRVVGLSRKGYLELLGFAHKVGHGRWLLHAQMTLCESGNSPPAYYEGSHVDSKEEISLSSSGSYDVSGQAFEGTKRVANRERQEEEASEKERNFTPRIYGESSQKAQFSSLEDAILRAKPSDEPDRAKTNLRKSS
jgi:hypothetical protein